MRQRLGGASDRGLHASTAAAIQGRIGLGSRQKGIRAADRRRMRRRVRSRGHARCDRRVRWLWRGVGELTIDRAPLTRQPPATLMLAWLTRRRKQALIGG